jgi:hypothetical protein
MPEHSSNRAENSRGDSNGSHNLTHYITLWYFPRSTGRPENENSDSTLESETIRRGKGLTGDFTEFTIKLVERDNREIQEKISGQGLLLSGCERKEVPSTTPEAACRAQGLLKLEPKSLAVLT